MSTRRTWVVLAAAAAGVAVLVAGEGQAEPAMPSETVVMCPEDEPGQRVVFSGRVLDMDGRPLAKAAVVAYGTDREGNYSPPGSGTRVPRLSGVAVTDEDGRYAFETVYPGGYPGRDDPSHIHLTVAAPMHGIMYVTFWFEGDPRLTPAKRRALDGETVIVRLEERGGGELGFRHEIRLRGN